MQFETTKRSTIPIVLASGHADDRETLNAILAGSPWELVCVANLREAIRALNRVTVPIVLLDQDLDGYPWQNAVKVLTGARPRTRVTVLAAEAGPLLSAEAARQSGFDLLRRPLDRQQVYATLTCAYAQFKTNWPFLTVSRRQRRPPIIGRLKILPL
jgi:DNA-binding NtrC family response regulator